MTVKNTPINIPAKTIIPTPINPSIDKKNVQVFASLRKPIDSFDNLSCSINNLIGICLLLFNFLKSSICYIVLYVFYESVFQSASF